MSDAAVNIGLIALFWGLISAVSLPLGSLCGLYFSPKKLTISILMAFGAGALLFALSIELFAHSLHYIELHGVQIGYATIVGAIIGGLLFDFLNQLLNNRGAFIRNLSNTKNYIARGGALLNYRKIRELQSIHILKSLDAPSLALLLQVIEPDTISEGEILFHQNEAELDYIYLIRKGSVKLAHFSDHKDTDSVTEIIQSGGMFGLTTLMSSAEYGGYIASAQATRLTTVFKIKISSFLPILRDNPNLQHTIRSIAYSRVNKFAKINPQIDVTKIKESMLKFLDDLSNIENQPPLSKTKRLKSAGLAIWLGILIDTFPESLVIGMLAVSPDGISYAFIVGVFLANFPEAMSSSSVLKRAGFRRSVVLAMWLFVCIITGIGAYIGATLFPAHPTGHTLILIAAIEGLAAGAMLTAIAETMLPEAFEHGGAITGFSCLCGYLCSMLVKLI